jgi:putative ABC transport system substrate-binding protein
VVGWQQSNGEAPMNKRILILLLTTVLLATVSLVTAQPLKNVPKVGILLPWSPGSEVSLSFVKAFSQGLRELGYVQGQNLATAYRYGEGLNERYPNLAAELVQLKVDVIVTTAGPPARAAKQATNSIPIVFTQVTDPVAEGLVASLARPEGNITGLSQMGPDLAGKRLELLKESFPKVSRIAVLRTTDTPGPISMYEETQIAAKTMRVQLQSLEVRSADDFERAFRAATTSRAGALIVIQSALINTHRTRVVELARKRRLPTMFMESAHVEAGGLMSYGPSFFDLHRRAATYVDKILKGRKPEDLPVEQPMKFEFVINLKTAKQIGLTIPQWTLMKADRVIR